MIAGAGLGAGVIHTLNAQARPPAFIVSENTIRDQDIYMKQFVPAVIKTIDAAGGKFLARGGKIESLLGEAPPARTVLLQFPSMDKALEWWNSQATKDAVAIGQKSGDIREYVLKGSRNKPGWSSCQTNMGMAKPPFRHSSAPCHGIRDSLLR